MENNSNNNEPTTPLMVRDAIVTCFNEAHCLDAGIDKDESLNEQYCKSIVEKAFKDVGGDFDKPTKEAITAVLDKLAEFAKNFRDQDVIKKHYNGIMSLVERME